MVIVVFKTMCHKLLIRRYAVSFLGFSNSDHGRRSGCISWAHFSLLKETAQGDGLAAFFGVPP